MFPKTKRKVDKKLLESYHDKTCEVNKDCLGQVTAHHIKTKGARGDDVGSNLIALCMKHHSLIHSMGTYSFLKIYKLKRDNE